MLEHVTVNEKIKRAIGKGEIEEILVFEFQALQAGKSVAGAGHVFGSEEFAPREIWVPFAQENEQRRASFQNVKASAGGSAKLIERGHQHPHTAVQAAFRANEVLAEVDPVWITRGEREVAGRPACGAKAAEP